MCYGYYIKTSEVTNMIKNLIEKLERKRMKKSLVNGQNSFTIMFLEYLHYCENVSYEINDGRIVKVVDTLN